MSDGVFFIGIILFFFLLWFVSGGPTRPISFAGPYITPVTDVGQSQAAYGDDGWFSLPDAGGLFSGASIQSGTSISDPSPLRGQVRITGVSSGTNADDEYVSIQLESNAPGPVTISGWMIKSDATHKSVTIPNGAELPRRGVNQTGPITLLPGDRATIATGDSPVGVSFRENRCVGYFGSRQSFNPPLMSNCPAPIDEFERYYDGNQLADDSCYQYVLSLPHCTTPTQRGRPRLTGRCEEFVDERLDYDGCVAAHGLEDGFRSQEWRIYLERNTDLWKTSREAVRLLDGSGKTVDLYTY